MSSKDIATILLVTLIAFLFLWFFWMIEVKAKAEIEIKKMDEYKLLHHWTERDFIIWRYQREARGDCGLYVKVAIKKAKKIVCKYKRDLEQLEQKEDEKRALEARKKLEETLKERGYR